jgi:hypothetical protein
MGPASSQDSELRETQLMKKVCSHVVFEKDLSKAKQSAFRHLFSVFVN